MDIFAGGASGSMTSHDFYSQYSTLAESLAIFGLILFYKKRFNRQEWEIIIWFAISSIIALVALILWKQRLYNGWWYNLTNFFQYGFPGYFYYKYSNNSTIKKMILISFPLVFCISIVRLSIVGLVYIDDYSTILFNLLDSVFAFFFLKQLFEDVNISPFNVLAFWFCFPAMIDAMCTIPCYAAFPMYIKHYVLDAFSYILEFSYTFWHLMFAIGIVYTQRKKAQLQTI